ncbi:unnamed protein product, partial [Mycena citricolor]
NVFSWTLSHPPPHAARGATCFQVARLRVKTCACQSIEPQRSFVLHAGHRISWGELPEGTGTRPREARRRVSRLVVERAEAAGVARGRAWRTGRAGGTQERKQAQDQGCELHVHAIDALVRGSRHSPVRPLLHLCMCSAIHHHAANPMRP